MAPVRIAIAGALGRMGRQMADAVQADSRLALTARFHRTALPAMGWSAATRRSAWPMWSSILPRRRHRPIEGSGLPRRVRSHPVENTARLWAVLHPVCKP
ncbi:hypothetical protein LB561_11315 [Mesorhizobium sp. B292B1B]|nr:hypothetical protein [Mesorhizobium sp. B294B1A1]MCA0037877.1 hypothetical protein [Mesorhizobium sp. B292B1B]